MIWVAAVTTWALFGLLIGWLIAQRLARYTALLAPVSATALVVFIWHWSPRLACWVFLPAVLYAFAIVLEIARIRKSERMRELYNKIFDAGCVKFGEFKLKSGIMSPVYCDLRMLVSVPEVLAEVGKALGQKAKEIGCDRVAGIPYGGVPIAVAASIASGIPMIYPRKEIKDHGTRQAIEGTHKAGERVLVIDDLVTSGMSFNEAVEPLKSAGLVVTDLLVILDREQGGAKVIANAGYKLHSLVTLSQMVNALVEAGKIDADMQAKVAEFIAANQFA